MDKEAIIKGHEDHADRECIDLIIDEASEATAKEIVEMLEGLKQKRNIGEDRQWNECIKAVIAHINENYNTPNRSEP